ncbi:ubiquinone biosynthesis monooxygenase Coq7 [Recurvomyces mirabilis]|uniref:5-demethoxyubiquinone hydroxylase, mitochondrial n=1 Tax=Recurvomyces mirabilis TaxID=574656 RepID=A0AAE1C5Q0_9PEZI|nr:ubiquinone biosynthesis monooxygenase Coq7 [Recurvomyces mirabilis]KAK5161452.1 ubiquinone biosynthesis monooxygenase Coq7 [Recurvomyces mirabilis]
MSPSLPLRTRLSPLAFQLATRRHVTPHPRTIVSSAASSATEPEPASLHTPQPTRRKPLSAEQKRFLDSALRVNQAGELAATLIYTAQTPPLNKSHPHLRPLMKHMYDQEAGHFTYFNHILAKHRIRPTLMYPFWHVAATGLGWVTGAMGREAAMACTEAVETEIGGHYNGQVKVLLAWVEGMERRGEEIGEELQGLIKEIRRIRDEELEHLDHAVENDAKEAKPYELLTGVIRAGCRGAIWVSEKV